ncbi:MAG TPA: TetR/AcrR family transcriptional regulator [Paracoccaceae bacterium]|nr:TetR/AcrR family transcriptional regulator [Paracoccaceae bacterium]
MAAALALFRARGYEGVGVAELTEAMGINAPSLYAAFGSKRGLYERALQRYAAEAGGYLPEVLAGPGSAATVLRDVFLKAVETMTAKGAPRGCLMLDGARYCADPDVVRLNTERQKFGRDLIRDRIARERPELAEELADYAMVVLRGLSAGARDGLSLERLRATAETAAEGLARRLESAPVSTPPRGEA